jgi:hypothetical protein
MRRVRLLLLLLVALTAISCAGAAPSVQAPPARPAPLFELHSGLWLNVHQRLHHAATGRRPPPASAPAQPTARAWIAAVDFYKKRFGERGGMGLFFDAELVAMNRTLSGLGSSPLPTGLPPELAAPLGAAVEIVRPEWPEHDRANRAWIGALEPALEEHGEALRSALSAAYQAPWPPSPIRVDVSSLAGPFGAYTVLGPVHITISSADPAYAGDAALEMIFHEASHALIDPIEKKLEQAAAKRGRKAPDQLWHAVLFYCTGEIVKRRLGPGYVPYATKNGLWSRGPWVGFEAALRRSFQGYLDGAVDLDAAVAALIDGVPDSR